jgi:hypothetical protein
VDDEAEAVELAKGTDADELEDDNPLELELDGQELTRTVLVAVVDVVTMLVVDCVTALPDEVTVAVEAGQALAVARGVIVTVDTAVAVTVSVGVGDGPKVATKGRGLLTPAAAPR